MENGEALQLFVLTRFWAQGYGEVAELDRSHFPGIA
jgi:hypothetical protein